MTPADALVQLREADAALLAAGPIPFPLPIGELAPIVAGTVSALEARDWWVPGLRERAGAAIRGVPVDRMVDGLRGAGPYHVAPPGGSPALRALYAVGLATEERPAIVHLGIGSASDGALHEALNLAALRRAPVVFVVAVHPLGGDAPLGPQLAASPAALARSFGVAAVQVDGTDAQAVHDAVAAARAAGGPHLIEATLSAPEDK